MIVPGLPMDRGAGGILIVYSVDAENVNPWLELGNPTAPLDITVVVNAGVTISSVSPGYPPTVQEDPLPLLPAMDLSTAVAESRIYLINNGEIKGAGGAGGYGGIADGLVGGAGGGGAGIDGGLGGQAEALGEPNNSVGFDGTELLGGVGGLQDTSTNPGAYDGGAGQRGGTAVFSGDIAVTIDNVNEIWSGGGGGGGAQRGVDNDSRFEDPNQVPNVGGEPGAAGDDGIGQLPPQPPGYTFGVGGEAGYAVQGSDITWISGEFAPNLKGQIGEPAP